MGKFIEFFLLVRVSGDGPRHLIHVSHHSVDVMPGNRDNLHARGIELMHLHTVANAYSQVIDVTGNIRIVEHPIASHDIGHFAHKQISSVILNGPENSFCLVRMIAGDDQ